MSLYHTYRPDTLGKVKGNKGVVSSLSSFLKSPEKMPHAYLFHGGTGCGKTTLARIIKNTLGISDNDYKEMDSAQFNGVDMIRQLRKDCQYKPTESPYRMYVLDECHMLTGPAQESALKILEDTPKHVIFVLCTTEPNKLKPTIRGRCQQYQMNPLSDTEMEGMLKNIARKEGTKLEQEVMGQIVLDSLGHPRAAIQILEQVLNTEPEGRLEAAKQTALEQSQSIELVKALLKGVKWKAIAAILTRLKGQEPESIRRAVLGYCQAILLKGAINGNVALIIEEFIEPFYHTGFPQLTYACLVITEEGK